MKTMSEEVLLQALRKVDETLADEVRAHIAALTAEREQFRDDLVRASEFAHQGGTGSPVTREGRDAIESIGALWNRADDLRTQLAECAACAENIALRERVKALNADVRTEQSEVLRLIEQSSARHERALVAESRLAAIRQWVEGFADVVSAAAEHANRPRGGQQVPFHGDFGNIPPSSLSRLEWYVRAAREIVGDDDPAPSEMDGLEGEMAGTPCEGHDIGEFCGACGNTGVDRRGVEPTAAEAFATVRKSLSICNAAHLGAECALSQLERRMKAQDATLRRVLAAWKAHEVTGSPTLFFDVERALTDAPPVFTLEEVQGVVDGVFNDTTNGREVDPKHDVKWFYRQVSMRLAALR